MPALPKPLRRPHPWLAFVIIGIVLFALDILRSPSTQISARFYSVAVKSYQWAKPKCGVKGCCRFVPSCSRYSSEAVQHYGVVEGLDLTIERLKKCKSNVPLGTQDSLFRVSESGF